MKLNSTFRKISERLAADFDNLASETSHSQLSGESREHALRGLLEKYLPQRVGVDRGIVIDLALARAQCDTIRLKLLKISAQVRITVRKVWVSPASGSPYAALFAQVYHNLRASPERC